MLFKPGTILFATADTAEGRADARAWLKEKAMTPEQVRLYREGDMVLVAALVPVSVPQ